MKKELRLLFPLDLFYTEAELPYPGTSQIQGKDIPEPYRYLLANDHDMTPTLEAFHGEPIHLRVIKRRVDGSSLSRMVVLTLNGSRRPVEFGAIIIHLQHFPRAAQEEILKGQRPLGTILSVHRIDHQSCPQAFLRLTSDRFMNDALRLEEPHTLYGRRNVLIDLKGNTLADIIEILPPVHSTITERKK